MFYKKVVAQETKLVDIVHEMMYCDKCGNLISTSSDEKDCENFIELNEMIHIDHVCGYGSIYDDGAIVKLDFCQECWFELFKPFIERQQREMALLADDIVMN